MKTCAFTGHRPGSIAFGYREYHSKYFRFYNCLISEVQKLYSAGVKTYITGMAEGVDMWAAEAVLELKHTDDGVRLIAAIPYRGHINSISEEYKQRYLDILKEADEIIYVCDEYSKTSFKERNFYMIDNADILLAVYDMDNSRSGTGQTVRYAEKKGIPITVIDPDSLEITYL